MERMHVIKPNLKKHHKDSIIMQIQNRIISSQPMTGVVPNRTWRDISIIYNKSEDTIRRVWKQYQREKDQIDDEDLMRPKKKSRSLCEFDVNVAACIDDAVESYDGDITYREMKAILSDQGIEFSLSSIFKYCELIGMKAESSYVKPSLTEDIRMKRLKFIIDKINISNPNQLTYYTQEDIVHVDEKWFYQDSWSHRQYLSQRIFLMENMD